MKVRWGPAVAATAVLTLGSVLSAPTASASVQAVPVPAEQAICADLFDGVYSVPSSEPLARCQWDMALINADTATRARATGAGGRVGLSDSGAHMRTPHS